MTDRFALTDGSTEVACDAADMIYCGGTWQGIINKLDYVQDMGFDAIYISPITAGLTENTKEGENYHGYWPQDIYEANSNFGTADDLKDLAEALHNRGMWLMVDVVINDMGYAVASGDEASDIDYSVFTPFNSEEYFHSYCEITNYTNYTNAQVCWLGDDIVALPDLDTENDEVVSLMTSWVSDLVANYSVDGLRVDAAKHVSDAFLKEFATAAGMYSVGEVYEGDAAVFCPYQDLMPGMTNYPNYFSVIEAFTNGNISDLSYQIAVTKSLCPDTTILASFSENHDLPRIGYYTDDVSLAKSVIAYTIMADGVPMIYQGQEQFFTGNSTPYNREALWTSNYDNTSELYTFTTLANKMRRHAINVDSSYVDYQSQVIYTDGSTIALRKGNEGQQIITVLSNSGSEQTSYTLTIPNAFTPGTEVMEVVACKNYTINDYGQLQVPMDKGTPHIFFQANKMNGSFICGMGNWSVSNYGDGSSSAASTTQTSMMASSIGAILIMAMTFSLL